MALSLLVPGLGFCVAGRRLLGKCAMVVCCLLVLTHVVFLGAGVGNVAFGLLVSVHVASFLFLLDPWLSSLHPGRRVLHSLLVVAAFWLLMYLPMQGFAERHLAFPARVSGKVLVFRAGINPASLRAGDRVAFESRESFGHGFLLKHGLQFGQVVALPGDRVEFRPNQLLVNGRPHMALKHMPSSGCVWVKENCWLIWPEVTISRNNDQGAPVVSDLLLGASMVRPDQMRGRPVARWFWKKQT
jgi:hypothetical protein